jgi:2-methylcitrate dehydratase PrpD
LKNKKIINKLIHYPLGDPENPISNIDLKNKFLSLTKTKLNKKSEKLIDQLLIESQDIKPRKLINKITNLQR